MYFSMAEALNIGYVGIQGGDINYSKHHIAEGETRVGTIVLKEREESLFVDFGRVFRL